MMTARYSYRWVCPGMMIICWLAFVLPVECALSPNRIQVLINLPSRPIEGSPRDTEALFDHKATLMVKILNPSEVVPMVRIQWILLYDDISTSGRIKRQQLSDVTTFPMKQFEERNFESKPLRLTGKINKSGQLIGMRYVGYGVRIYDEDKLTYESYQPQDLEHEIAELLPPLDVIQAGGKIAPGKSPKSAENAKVNTVSDTQRTKTEAGAASGFTANGAVTLFDYTFTKHEAEAILRAANQFSEDELVSIVGLTKQAAHNLILKRPFQKLEELSKVSYVKKQAMGTFKEFVLKK